MDKTQIQEKTKKLLEKAKTPEQFTKELQELLKSFIDKEATKNYQRIIPDTGKFYGVPLPILGIIAAEIGKFIQKEPSNAPLLLATIWNESSFEARQIAGKSLEKFAPKNPKDCLDFISSVLPDLDNWANCDNLAMYGVEPIVYQSPKLVLPLSEKWIKDKKKWIRRFGVVSLRGYKKVQTKDKVFKILDLVMEDKDKDIKKAVAWILREITKRNPDKVAKFLMKWAKASPAKDTIWIIKDGMKKLSSNEQKKILKLIGSENMGQTKIYPTIGVCGLDCGLCPRYYTAGASRCPGCCGPNFFNKHPSCSFITCCVKKKNLEVCADCSEFPCSKFKTDEEYQQLKQSSSYPPYKKAMSNLNFIKKHGIKKFIEQQGRRIKLLETMIENFDDGRSRSFFCRAAALLSIADLEKSLKNSQEQKIKAGKIRLDDVKTKSIILKGFLNECAAKEGVELKLRGG